MAATLPPIGGSTGRTGGAGVKMQQYTQPLPPPQKKKTLIKLAPIKKALGKAERDLMEKRKLLRSQQPMLSKQETAEYRNSYIHNLCLDMLSAGYHLSFKELFALINRQEEDRQRAGPESLMWTQIMITEEEEKLNMLQKYLTLAETSERKDELVKVYEARQQLAVFFQSTGDKWLSDHFFSTCLKTGSRITQDGGRLHAEGQCNMGLALELSGDHFDAAEHFEFYYLLSCDHEDWMKEDVTFCTDACIHLCRIYSTIGERIEDADPEKSLEYLVKAFDKAKESGDKLLEGEAAYKLGLAYEQSGDGETALKHLTHYLDTCKSVRDNEGMGRACDAIAKAYARKGDVEQSVIYLKQFVEMAEKSGKDEELSRACHNLGNLYNKLGQYEEASHYFGKAYSISRSQGKPSSIHVNRVQYGIALAHRMMSSLGSHIVQSSLQSIDRLIEWKSSRTDDFDKPYPESEEEEEEEEEADSVPPPFDSQATINSQPEVLETEEGEQVREATLQYLESADQREGTADTNFTLTTEGTEASSIE